MTFPILSALNARVANLPVPRPIGPPVIGLYIPQVTHRPFKVLGIAWTLVATALLLGANPMLADANPDGLPFIRFYSFDEIGNVSKGSVLSFDRFGRVGVVQNGEYFVLNDDSWLNAADKGDSSANWSQVVRTADGAYYYGALGNWGVLETNPAGFLQMRSLIPSMMPKWALKTSFNQIFAYKDQMVFASGSGIVTYNTHTQQTHFLELPSTARVFVLEGSLYVSRYHLGVDRIQFIDGQPQLGDRLFGGDMVVDNIAASSNRTLLSTVSRRLYFYADGAVTPLAGPLAGRLPGRITNVVTLDSGKVAVSVNNFGLFILHSNGEIETSLTAPEYRQISSLATQEPGVLWAATESGVAKILHGRPVTSFGQSLGLSISWPQLVKWNGRTVIASAGRIYEPAPAQAGEALRFQISQDQPEEGAWGIAAIGDWLLTANSAGVFGKQPGGKTTAILPQIAAARLVALDAITCLVIGEREITAIRLRDGAWYEIAQRVPGVGYPAQVHRTSQSVWVEIGANHAARILYKDGKVEVHVFDRFPWKGHHWVSISVIDDLVILTGPPGGRVFFDERTGDFSAGQPLADTLAQAPFWPVRLRKSGDGPIWASYDHGIFTIDRSGAIPSFDTNTYRLIHENTPVIHVLSGDEIWASTGSSLFRLFPQRAVPPAQFDPMLVFAQDSRTGRDLLPVFDGNNSTLRVAYAENSISLRFFCGSYGLRRSPRYDVKINDGEWSSLDTSSVLRLANLSEGGYEIGVRLSDGQGPLGRTRTIHLLIAPPWYRSHYAYLAYTLAGALMLYMAGHWLVRRTRAHNRALTETVKVRTDELQTAMAKLQRETQTAATLAERNRLAGELHDSLEQGFSALMLQLQTLSSFPRCTPELQSGLTLAKNMVAFSRNELRHAIWDLHSPRLDENNLESAIRQILTEILPDSARADIVIEGAMRPLDPTTEHHTLRIAQEAIANAVKHSMASLLSLRLKFTDTHLELSIIDNGCGFDSVAVRSNTIGHFGLQSLRSRAAKINASLEITSAPCAGTRVCLRVPSALPSTLPTIV